MAISSSSGSNSISHPSSPSICTYTLVDYNPFSRKQLKKSLALEAHHNRELLFMKSILEQLKSLNRKKQPSSKQKFAVKKLQQMI